jgi:hypothetical protein
MSASLRRAAAGPRALLQRPSAQRNRSCCELLRPRAAAARRRRHEHFPLPLLPFPLPAGAAVLTRPWRPRPPPPRPAPPRPAPRARRRPPAPGRTRPPPWPRAAHARRCGSRAGKPCRAAPRRPAVSAPWYARAARWAPPPPSLPSTNRTHIYPRPRTIRTHIYPPCRCWQQRTRNLGIVTVHAQQENTRTARATRGLLALEGKRNGGGRAHLLTVFSGYSVDSACWIAWWKLGSNSWPSASIGSTPSFVRILRKSLFTPW